eukprot:SAG11_NODE_18319_length_494_cov_1.559494_1_plen_129_part_10
MEHEKTGLSAKRQRVELPSPGFAFNFSSQCPSPPPPTPPLPKGIGSSVAPLEAPDASVAGVLSSAASEDAVAINSASAALSYSSDDSDNSEDEDEREDLRVRACENMWNWLRAAGAEGLEKLEVRCGGR